MHPEYPINLFYSSLVLILANNSLYRERGGTEKTEQLEAALEKVTKERDALHQELSEPYAMRARLSEAEQTIKRLKLELSEQSELIDFNGRSANEYKQRLDDFVKCRAKHSG